MTNNAEERADGWRTVLQLSVLEERGVPVRVSLLESCAPTLTTEDIEAALTRLYAYGEITIGDWSGAYGEPDVTAEVRIWRE